jgi:hypothetical protein
MFCFCMLAYPLVYSPDIPRCWDGCSSGKRSIDERLQRVRQLRHVVSFFQLILIHAENPVQPLAASGRI